MRFHYAGTYSGDEADLPQRSPMPVGAVQFREPETLDKLVLIAAVVSLVILIPSLALVVWRCGIQSFVGLGSLVGIVLSLVAAVPHEFLHAMWFKEDVYMYTNIKQGMLFVVGPEDMTLGHFVWMSFFPALILGVLPLVAFVVWYPSVVLGVFGAFSLSYAAGDFINIFNASTQMPRGARAFLSGMRSYWYLPQG
ncbi:MAG: DUF3267 domain-containing protein [Atopobiaceae bacterium]|nr:DUF3267 domain-containing protein [Atopobiaceae bacterium]